VGRHFALRAVTGALGWCQPGSHHANSFPLASLPAEDDQADFCTGPSWGKIALRRNKPGFALAKLEGSKGSIKGKLKRAGWKDEFLARPLGYFAIAHMR